MNGVNGFMLKLIKMIQMTIIIVIIMIRTIVTLLMVICFEVLEGLRENSTIKQLDIRLTGVAKQVKITVVIIVNQ